MIPLASAHGGDAQAAAVLLAKDKALALLERRRPLLRHPSKFYQFYGQILDVEDTLALRKVWRAVTMATER